jgi:natural product precursor
MKKSNKLNLNQETLRNLTNAELSNVAGGFVVLKYMDTHTPCVCFGTCPPPVRPAQ